MFDILTQKSKAASRFWRLSSRSNNTDLICSRLAERLRNSWVLLVSTGSWRTRSCPPDGLHTKEQGYSHDTLLREQKLGTQESNKATETKPILREHKLGTLTMLYIHGNLKKEQKAAAVPMTV
jgi:hypothetical protein